MKNILSWMDSGGTDISSLPCPARSVSMLVALAIEGFGKLPGLFVNDGPVAAVVVAVDVAAWLDGIDVIILSAVVTALVVVGTADGTVPVSGGIPPTAPPTPTAVGVRLREICGICGGSSDLEPKSTNCEVTETGTFHCIYIHIYFYLVPVINLTLYFQII